jgi:3-oxoacyl-[acyl-carrier-protein] synthase-3
LPGRPRVARITHDCPDNEDMIGISEIASYIPPGFESNFDKLEKFSIDRSFIDEKIGVYRVSRKAPDEDTSDLCMASFAQLRRKCGIEPGDVDCIVVCTQNPDGRGLPHVSAVLHGRLGLPRRCASFDISLGCSGYVYTLSIMKAFMEAQGFRTGLLFTADPYSKIIDPDDKNTVLLFGDGAAVTLLRRGLASLPLLTPTAFDVDSNGLLASALCNVDGKLRMNGRQVFTYSVTTVPDTVRNLLDKAGIGKQAIDFFLFHQGSKYIVDAIAKRLELPVDKVARNMTEHGNTVSSTIPILLEPLVHDARAQRILACGFGVGLSTAACILERRASD